MFLTNPLASVWVALAFESRDPCPQHANLLFLLLQLNTLLLDLLVCNTLSRKKVNEALAEKKGEKKDRRSSARHSDAGLQSRSHQVYLLGMPCRVDWGCWTTRGGEIVVEVHVPGLTLPSRPWALWQCLYALLKATR